MRTFVAFRSTSCEAPAGGAATRKETDRASTPRGIATLRLSRRGDTTGKACAHPAYVVEADFSWLVGAKYEKLPG